MKKYVLALDQGTTSSRCILFDKQGNICSMAQKEFESWIVCADLKFLFLLLVFL